MMDSSVTSTPSAIGRADSDSNLLLGLIGGGAAMLASAVLWGLITYFTEYQIGWMAIGVGFLVGFAVRFLGKGNTPAFGFSGALLALVGCILGNLMFYSGVIAREQASSVIEVLFYLLLNPGAIVDIFAAAFDFKDLLFYAIAAYVGFRSAMDKAQGG